MIIGNIVWYDLLIPNNITKTMVNTIDFNGGIIIYG